MTLKNIIKFWFLLIFITFLIYFENNEFNNQLISILVIFFSIYFLNKCKYNLGLTLMAIFILYSNYSIVIGEYIVGGDLAAPMAEVKNVVTYGILIKSLLIFILLLSICVKKTRSGDFNKLTLKENEFIYYGSFIILLYILIFGINRVELSTYAVSTKPIYEYAYLLILLNYYFSGTSKLKKIILLIIVTIFILQDFYYGGRITSIQLSIVLILTIFSDVFNYAKVLFLAIFGIILNSVIALYRAQYSLENINLISVLINLKKNLFVFDTPVFAYYASATHIATVDAIDWTLRLKSFGVFILSLFTGSNNVLGNVTQYVSLNFYKNLGGGVIFSHFYFWLGWLGVILISLLICFLINTFSKAKSEFGIILFIVIICTVPRWYLYTPLLLFRPIILITILYVFSINFHKFVIRKKLDG